MNMGLQTTLQFFNKNENLITVRIFYMHRIAGIFKFIFQRQCQFIDSVRNTRHHPGYGDIGTKCPEAADCRDREANQRTIPDDSNYYTHSQQAW